MKAVELRPWAHPTLRTFQNISLSSLGGELILIGNVFSSAFVDGSFKFESPLLCISMVPFNFTFCLIRYKYMILN